MQIIKPESGQLIEPEKWLRRRRLHRLGGTGTGGTGTSTGGADIPAALPRTSGAGVLWGALAALAAVLLGSSVWMQLCQRR